MAPSIGIRCDFIQANWFECIALDEWSKAIRVFFFIQWISFFYWVRVLFSFNIFHPSWVLNFRLDTNFRVFTLELLQVNYKCCCRKNSKYAIATISFVLLAALWARIHQEHDLSGKYLATVRKCLCTSDGKQNFREIPFRTIITRLLALG